MKNPEICVKAINKIIESNDALRIRIKKDGNNVFQYISQYCYEEIPIFNCVNKTLIEKKQEMEIDAKKSSNLRIINYINLQFTNSKKIILQYT